MAELDVSGSPPSVSVVVPALNEAASIVDCLRSLAAQDYRGPVEVVVVDNGSDDDTARIARSCGAVVVAEPRRGVCRARQAGTAASTGDLVVSTDADTTFSTSWLSSIVAEFDRGGTSVVSVCGPCRFVDGPRWARAYTSVLFGYVYLFFLVTGRVCYASATNIAFRRSAWTGYDVTMTQGGDELALVRALRTRGKVRFVRRNPTWTSSRRLHRGFAYSVFVTCLWYYLIAYTVNRLAGRIVIGNAPVIRGDERAVPTFRRRTRLIGYAFGCLVIAGIYLATPIDIDIFA